LKKSYRFLDTLTYKIYISVSDLPDQWNTFAHGNIFLSTDYLRVLETSAPKNMTCFFIGLFDKDGLAGVSLAQFLDLSDVSSFGERDNCLKMKIRNFVFKRFASHVLILGNNMLSGENTLRLGHNIQLADALQTLAKALDHIRNGLASQGINTHLIIWKDFSQADAEHFRIPEFDPYFRFSTQPNMVLDIRNNWNSDADYIADLNKKYRDQYKRARKKAEDIAKRKMSLEEIIANNDTIYELYFTVVKNAPFNTFYLSRNHFIALKQLLGEQFLFYGYFVGGKLIGFDTLIKNGEATDTYFLGYDENFQKERMLYLNMLYNMIAYSVNKKYKKVIFARTALEIKSSVGAKPIFLAGFIKHSNSLINFFMPRLFPFFEPDVAWHERHPFKEPAQPASGISEAS
jgi:hypothetical protein